MTKIKFGTDGWRAIIADDFTVENVARVTEGTAIWLKKNFEKPSVVVGHDCRFAGELFAETVAKVMLQHEIPVHLAKGFVSTPMISLGAKNYGASLGIIITASHNPPSYNGYKLKGFYGGPLLPDKIEEIELLRARTQTNFPWSNGDGTALKTIVRSNPGVTYLRKGVVVSHSHFNDFPLTK
jgi:phosphomannomutase